MLDSAVLRCLASACIAALTLPFAVNRAKWLSFVSCLLNASGIALVLIASIRLAAAPPGRDVAGEPRVRHDLGKR
jgi:hypothetical protein